MTDNLRTIVLRRDRDAGLWVASFSCPQDGHLITAPTPFADTVKAGTVVDYIRFNSPNLRIGVDARDIGGATLALALQMSGEPVVWLKHPSESAH